MSKSTVALLAAALGLIVGFLLGNRTATPESEPATSEPASAMSEPVSAMSEPAPVSVAAVPGEKGGQDIFGAYEPVADWPKPLSDLPQHEQWTWGSAEGVFAESPDRVFVLQRGELPNIPRPRVRILPEVGPGIAFPMGGVPFRNATFSSPPAAGGTTQVAEDGIRLYTAPTEEGGRGFTFDVDARWEHCLIVVDADGNIIEERTQWDSMFKRPHAIYISPYDPDKHVWVVDDHSHAIFKFTNDGEELVQTIGIPGQLGADETHFHRPTFIAWLSDGTFFVADGYNGTRVVKFDRDGNFLLDWGQKGNPPNETRPGYMNNVHGIAVNPETRRVFVNDRANKRIQVFDENGTYLDEWRIGNAPAQFYTIYMGADGYLWGGDYGTSKMVKYDSEGNFLYSWGTRTPSPGGMWGVHQISVDQEGNVYIAEVNHGRVQKFRPREGANPAFLVGKPVYSAWQ